MSNRFIRTLAALAAGVLLVLAQPAVAVEPLTGPQYDKQMVIDQDDGPLGMTVGMFAACAQERVMSIVAGGGRAMPDRRVRGEDVDGVFVVTVPGVNEDIQFFFEPVDGGGEGERLFLARMAIGSVIATRTRDKEGAISALIPNCI